MRCHPNNTDKAGLKHRNVRYKCISTRTYTSVVKSFDSSMVTNRILCATQHIAGPLSVWRASAIISHGQLLWVRLPLTFSAVKSSVRHSCIVQLPVLSNQSAIIRYWVSGSLSSNGDAAPGSKTSGCFLRVALTTTEWSTTLGLVEATPFSRDKLNLP